MPGRSNNPRAPAAQPAAPVVNSLDQPLDDLVAANRPRQGTKRRGNSDDNGRATKKPRPNKVYDEDIGLAETSKDTRGPVLKSLDMASVDVSGQHLLFDRNDADNRDFEDENVFRTVITAPTTEKMVAIFDKHMARLFRRYGGRQVPVQMEIRSPPKGDIKMINKKYHIQSEGSAQQQAAAARARQSNAIEATPAEPVAQLEATIKAASKPAAQQQVTGQYSGQSSGRGNTAQKRPKDLAELDEAMVDYFSPANKAKLAAEVAANEQAKKAEAAKEAEGGDDVPEDWEFF